MYIAILVASSLLLTCASLCYLSYPVELDEKRTIGAYARALVCKRGLLIYSGIMMLCLCILSVSLSLIYATNSIIINVKLIVLLAVIFVAAWTDHREHIIPNQLIAAALIVRFVFYVVELFTDTPSFWPMLKSDLIACLIAAAFFIMGVLIMKNGIGMGDVKLMLVMCLFQGFYGVVGSIFFSLLVAFVLSIALLVTKKKSRKDAVAFAPSLLVGTFISVFLTGM